MGLNVVTFSVYCAQAEVQEVLRMQYWMSYASIIRLFRVVQLATHCYHLPSLSHCFTLSTKPAFSENLILHFSLFLSVGLI